MTNKLSEGGNQVTSTPMEVQEGTQAALNIGGANTAPNDNITENTDLETMSTTDLLTALDNSINELESRVSGSREKYHGPKLCGAAKKRIRKLMESGHTREEALKIERNRKKTDMQQGTPGPKRLRSDGSTPDWSQYESMIQSGSLGLQKPTFSLEGLERGASGLQNLLISSYIACCPERTRATNRDEPWRNRDLQELRSKDILFDMTTRLGMLEFRCRYFQKKALRGGGAGKYQPIKKKIAPPPPIKLNADAVKKAEENIEFLLNASLKFQKERILEAFRENFQHRQINLYSVLQDYNRILRLCPELLIQDFETKHGPTTTAWEIWESLDIEAQYATLKHVTKRKINCIIQNWSPPVARALKFMALFPPVNTDKSGKKSNLIESVQKFIMFFPEGSTPAKIKATIEKETTRPQLFAMGPNKKLSRFYVKIEDIIVPLKTDFLKSLDFFFKLHYSLDLKPDHPYFCRFMAKYIYKIDKAPLGSPVMVKLASNLNLL
ncbi:hypothetical protein DMENIID0001_164120 [Sergentomyia squamirostris]